MSGQLRSLEVVAQPQPLPTLSVARTKSLHYQEQHNHQTMAMLIELIVLCKEENTSLLPRKVLVSGGKHHLEATNGSGLFKFKTE